MTGDTPCQNTLNAKNFGRQPCDVTHTRTPGSPTPGR